MRTIYPQPGHTEQELIDLLATRQFVFVDCFTIFPKVADPLRYSTAQRTVSLFPIDDDSTLSYYTSKEVKVSGVKMKAGVGVEVDEQTLRMDWDPDYVYYGMSMGDAIRRGRFDGSVIRRDRYFAANWGAPNQPVDWIGGCQMFSGRFSTVDRITRSSAEFKVKSNLILLNMKMPRNQFLAMCGNIFGDPVCGIDRIALQITSEVGPGSDSLTIYTTDAANTHKFGTADFEDQYNVTLVRTIKEVVVGSHIVLAAPLDFNPGEGEFFKLRPGCTRTYDTGDANCDTYWGDDKDDHYKGYPFVPTPETAY